MPHVSARGMRERKEGETHLSLMSFADAKHISVLPQLLVTKDEISIVGSGSLA